MSESIGMKKCLVRIPSVAHPPPSHLTSHSHQSPSTVSLIMVRLWLGYTHLFLYKCEFVNHEGYFLTFVTPANVHQ